MQCPCLHFGIPLIFGIPFSGYMFLVCIISNCATPTAVLMLFANVGKKVTKFISFPSSAIIGVIKGKGAHRYDAHVSKDH